MDGQPNGEAELRAQAGALGVDLGADREPFAEVLCALHVALEALAGAPGRLLLWESAPRADVAARLAGLGLASVVFAPCETPPADGSGYVAAMRANLDRLRAALNR